jgi:hypothetical protein
MQVSYMILAQVSPVTHSVGNCVKRVIVIVTSVLFFRTPVSTVNALGKSAILSKFQLYTYCIYSSCIYEEDGKADRLLHLVYLTGTGLALTGVFAYSQVKAKKGDKKIK